MLKFRLKKQTTKFKVPELDLEKSLKKFMYPIVTNEEDKIVKEGSCIHLCHQILANNSHHKMFRWSHRFDNKIDLLIDLLSFCHLPIVEPLIIQIITKIQFLDKMLLNLVQFTEVALHNQLLPSTEITLLIQEFKLQLSHRHL